MKFVSADMLVSILFKFIVPDLDIATTLSLAHDMRASSGIVFVLRVAIEGPGWDWRRCGGDEISAYHHKLKQKDQYHPTSINYTRSDFASLTANLALLSTA